MTQDNDIKLTPLAGLHTELGARMVPFAGYSMPVQYPSGVKQEHEHTRAQAGLFDVSHMGQLHLYGDAADVALEALVPADILSLPVNRQRYALFTNEAGGILDDLMVSRTSLCLVLVVNAGCKDEDEAHLRAHLPSTCSLERRDDLALLALQGPAAGVVLARLAPESNAMRFMDVSRFSIGGIECLVSRSGYTGEDGFEISVAAAEACDLAQALLAEPEVAPIGLGARDSLRLEAGLPLYGHDLDTTTTPIEAGMLWSIGKSRRPGAERAGNYPGASVVAQQIADGPTRRRVGLLPTGRAPIREGAVVVDGNENPVGVVTSGGFGPSLGGPIVMAYVETSALDGELGCVVRGKSLPVTRTKMPFVAHRYSR
jgi:aminomethyltransferase